jgi:serine/threonine-protein phosphatase Stp1
MEDQLSDTDATTIPQPGPQSFRLASAARSDVGRVRRINEDAFLERPEIGLWAVADGVGGESAGDRASRLIVEALGKVGAPSTAAGFLAEVRDSLQAVNHLLRLEAAAVGDARVIASTIVALLAFGHHFACAWAGDSRLYLWRNGRLTQISRDHSEVQEMVECGMLTADEARTHPRANVVTRAVGADDVLTLEMVQDQIRAGDIFLLCSDGLTKMLDDHEIAVLLGAEDGANPTETLVAAALERGGTDNVTVVTIGAVQVADG